MRAAAVVRIVLGLLTVTPATQPAAQISGDVAVLSDYRYRGISLSGDRPAAQAGVGYDTRSGVFAGVFASTLDARFIASKSLLQAYAGYARRSGESSWDAGISQTAFPGARDYDFTEVHVGWTRDRWRLAAHYAPDYFGRDLRAAYVELNVAWPLEVALPADIRLGLVGHAGLLFTRTALETYPPTGPEQSRRVDGKAGVAFDRRGTKLEVAWVGSDSAAGIYPIRRESRRHVVVATLSHAF